MTNRISLRRQIALIVLTGSLWGVIESTLGYGLHLLRRVAPLPGLTGYILFPIGFFIMLAAARSTGRNTTALGVAAVAATVKLTSAFLPWVDWLFVVNPALSILAEGVIVAAGIRLFSFARSPKAFPQALAVAVGWRIVFLAAVVVLPVQKGILMKGSVALLTFLLLDSAVNALLIGVALWLGADTRRLQARGMEWSRAAGAVVAAALAVGIEVIISLVS